MWLVECWLSLLSAGIKADFQQDLLRHALVLILASMKMRRSPSYRPLPWQKSQALSSCRTRIISTVNVRLRRTLDLTN